MVRNSAYSGDNMNSPFNSLMNPAAVGQQFQQAFQQGREQRQQAEAKNALTAYAMNPQDTNALNALAQYQPEFVIQQRQKQQAAQVEQQKADLQRRAAGGDQAALAELAGVDFQAWNALDTKSKTEVKRRADYLGQAGLAVAQLPDLEQRAQAWDQAVMQGVQMGFADLAQYQGQYSDQALQGVLANAGMIKQFLDGQKIDYKVIPQGGYLQGFDSQGKPLPDAQGNVGFQEVPQAAADYLRQNPALAAEFDAKYGQGASQRVLGGAGSGQPNFP